MPDTIIFPVNETVDEQADTALLGVKGANLASMASMGLPVPPAFIISTQVGMKIAHGADEIGEHIKTEVRQSIADLEQRMNREFGGAEHPLLLSVRSGAAVSMPGMMDTILNLGMNDKTVLALERETGDSHFAWDSYRRFIQSMAHVVFDLDPDDFEDELNDLREKYGLENDHELSADDLKTITSNFLKIFEREAERPFPQDVWEQLDLALMAVFGSWNSDRARHFRKMHGMSDASGTAAIVQSMVFGNRDANSCTGVYFTRNPSTGLNEPYGEYMPQAQGEDVVSGIRTPMELTDKGRAQAFSDNPSMESALPAAFEELLKAGALLEAEFKEMQEIEFTVEAGKLYLLQTRTGKRNPKAGLRIAVEMAEAELISKEEAVGRIDANSMNAMLISKAAPKAGTRPFTKGLPASPGAIVGELVFSSDDAVSAQATGRSVILVRPETDPRDIKGMDAAVGILTSKGGMTSHAAVVARGMGKPCITAAMTIKIDQDRKTCTCAGVVVKEGDVVTLDGSSGQVFVGEHPIHKPEPDGNILKMMDWMKETAN